MWSSSLLQTGFSWKWFLHFHRSMQIHMDSVLHRCSFHHFCKCWVLLHWMDGYRSSSHSSAWRNFLPPTQGTLHLQDIYPCPAVNQSNKAPRMQFLLFPSYTGNSWTVLLSWSQLRFLFLHFRRSGHGYKDLPMGTETGVPEQTHSSSHHGKSAYCPSYYSAYHYWSLHGLLHTVTIQSLPTVRTMDLGLHNRSGKSTSS